MIVFEWRNTEKTILAMIEENHTDIVEPTHPDWTKFSTQEGIIPFVPEFIDPENPVREKRNNLLTACDWTQLPDAPVYKNAWSVYRQALRDITKQSGFPVDVVWPTRP